MVDTNHKQETDFAAFVGIDWADQKHAWALQIPGHREVERGDLDHKPEAIEVWAAELARRFGGRPIAVCLRLSLDLPGEFRVAQHSLIKRWDAGSSRLIVASTVTSRTSGANSALIRGEA